MPSLILFDSRREEREKNLEPSSEAKGGGGERANLNMTIRPPRSNQRHGVGRPQRRAAASGTYPLVPAEGGLDGADLFERALLVAAEAVDEDVDVARARRVPVCAESAWQNRMQSQERRKGSWKGQKGRNGKKGERERKHMHDSLFFERNRHKGERFEAYS